MTMKTYSIQPVCDLTEFSPSTLRRYESDYGWVFMPQRCKIGEKEYRVYTWREIEMLIYIKQKLNEGYTPDQAWQSFSLFDLGRLGAADAIDEHVYYINVDMEFCDEEESAA
jgi:DNA-binding transcriptional MerR regulator